MAASYRPRYHVSVPFGWANDPNGIIYYRGKVHLYYQHYPHKPEWGPMHWNHVVTEDFIHWEQRPVALVPDQPYELVCGCCSGSTVEKDGRLYLMYTAAQPMMQRQCIAVSEEEDFRDPRIIRHDGTFYMIAGIRYVDGGLRKEAPSQDQRKNTNPRQPEPTHKKEGWGNLCLLKSDDLFQWQYVGHMLYTQPEFSREFYRLDGVYECPDYFVVDSGEEVLITSPQNLPEEGHLYQNIHSVLFMLGHLDFETGHFQVETIGEIDSGFDFYAAQTLRMPDGRVIMIAWKEMWDRSFPSRKEEWAGTYTLPRELSVEGDRLIQKPVREIESFRRNPVCVDKVVADDEEVGAPGVAGNVIELRFTLIPGGADRSGVKLFCGPDCETLLYYERSSGLLVFDRKKGGVAITGREPDLDRRVCELGQRERIEFDLFLDVTSLEAFIDGGRHTMTGNVYPDPDKAQGIRFFAEGGSAEFVDIEKYDIV